MAIENKNRCPEYRVLADKKAFTELSGSNGKKRWIIIAVISVVAVFTSFVLWYDWAGLLAKSGKEDVAVRLLEFMGRKEQAVEVLTSAGYFEKAAELLFANKDFVKAVDLLSQHGNIEQVMAMISKINSPDTIHECVNVIEKYYTITERELHHLDENMIINVFDGTINYIYNHDPSRLQRTVRQRDSLTIWEDVWNIYRDIDIPKPRYLRYSFLLTDYRAYGDASLYSTPVIHRNHQNMITEVICTPESGYFNEKRYVFIYNTIGLVLLREEVYYRGIHILDICYERNQSRLLSKVCIKYLLSEEEVERYFDISDNVLFNEYSFTDTYAYDTNGRLSTIIRGFDAYDGLEVHKLYFKYLNNIRVVETRKLDVDRYNADGSIAYYVDPVKDFILFCDGNIVESFTINTKTEQWHVFE